MKWMLLILTISLLLRGCGNAPPPPMPKKFQPVVNPNPNYFMTVKRHVAPELAGKVKLVWVTTYYTTNQKCNESINKFEGISVPRTINQSIISHPNAVCNDSNCLVISFKVGFNKYMNIAPQNNLETILNINK
jgi:hypothetical protein